MKYNYQHMYLGTPEGLQSNLARDWSTLIKNIRKREDLYYQLVFHSHTAYQKQLLNQDQIRITTWIQQSNTLIAKIKQHQLQMSEQEHQIIEKYEHSVISFQNCIKLMGRIGAQILQILKIASNKVRSFDDSASFRFNVFKTVFMGLLTQREKLNLENAIKVVMDYCKQKMQHFLAKMQRNIDSIKRGQFVFSQQKSKKISPKKSMIQTERQRVNNLFQKKRDHSRKEQITTQRRIFKQNSQIQSIQRCQRNESERPKPEGAKQKTQCRPSQKHLKLEKTPKKKFKLYDSFYNVMLLSRHQYNEDLSVNIDVNIQRIYLELLNKNKQNMNHILNFTARYAEIKQKPLNFEQIVYKNSSTQYKSISFILKNTKQTTQIQDNNEQEEYFRFISTEGESNTTENIENNQQFLRDHMKKIAMTRAKFNKSPQIKAEDFPILTCKINKQLLSSIKTDSSKQQRHQCIKNRLPDIKRGSLDQKKNFFNYKTSNDYKETIDNIQESSFKQSKKRQSFFREERIQSQRPKMILKNVQVGLQIPNMKGERFCKQQELTSRQRKKTDTTLQSTICMRRTINKFIDNKLNLFF